MKKVIALTVALVALCINAFAGNPDPRNYTRTALGFYGNVKKAVVKEYTSPEMDILKGTKTYTFNQKGNILQYKVENAAGTYVRLYDFQRDANGKLSKLVISENGKADSYVVYGEGVETCYSYDDFVVSITVKHGLDSYTYDATERDNYVQHPENYISRSERQLDSKKRLVCEKVFTLGEESDRKECYYDSKGHLWKVVTYIDGEVDTTVEFCTDRKSMILSGPDGEYISTSSVKLYYY